ncbi:MAG: fructose-bisphosphatase class II [Syntrophotaleaceae bacterium]
MVILDRPRHEKIINEIRKAGFRIHLISDGDVAPAIAATVANSGVDMMIGIGGAPGRGMTPRPRAWAATCRAAWSS